MLTIILFITCLIVYLKSPPIAIFLLAFLVILVIKALSDIGKLGKNRKISYNEFLSVIERSDFEKPIDLEKFKKVIQQSVKDNTSFAYGMLAPFITTNKFEVLGGTLNKIAVYNWDKYNLFAIIVKPNNTCKVLRHIPLYIGNNIVIIKTKKTFNELKKDLQLKSF